MSSVLHGLKRSSVACVSAPLNYFTVFWQSVGSMALPWHTDRVVSTTRSFVIKQERANSGISLASLEIRWRNEKAINSTRNMILLLDTFHLFLN